MTQEEYIHLYKDLKHVIIPGLGNSGPDHWQTILEKNLPNASRVIQENWNEPDCNLWVNAIDAHLLNVNTDEVVLIGHSLGCIAIVNWAAQFNKSVRAALLVAPADIESGYDILNFQSFIPIQQVKLNFTALVVSSTNDPWVTSERARFFSRKWNADFISIGKAGHINANSGFGNWKEVYSLLDFTINKQKDKEKKAMLFF
jgi:predicted alpha/beta hydrolase family esterase